MEYRFFCPCPRGLEGLLVEELTGLGAQQAEQVPGGVAWSGDMNTCYRANLESRLATRVLWNIAEGRYQDVRDIYRLAYAQTWAKWFEVQRTMRVYVTAIRSELKSLEFTTLKIKDAICDHFRAVIGERPSIDTQNPDVRVHAFLTKDRVTLYLDTSGEPLYKRGFKNARVEAPIKENLAAGIIKISGWQPDEPFFDPMCGSGTFLLEAAQIALNIAPGLGRSFAFEKFKNFDATGWSTLRQAAEKRRQPARELDIFGADLNPDQVRRTYINLRAAGLAECVDVIQADILEGQPPMDYGVLVTNPPYGVRLGEIEELAAFYPRLGDILKREYSGWRCYFISGDQQLPKLIGLKASRKTPLFNGALECRVYEYKVVAGSNRRIKPGTE